MLKIEQEENMNKIRILGIAPYEAMKIQMMNIVKEFKSIELTPFTGDLEEGLAIAEANFHGNFDMVISRGATAELLKKKLSIPVIGVEISTDDIIQILKLANNYKQSKTAIISVADVSQKVKQISYVTGINIDSYTITERETTRTILNDCKAKCYKTVLCDMYADKEAKKMGLNSFLITSSDNSIRDAFSKAIELNKSMIDLRNENRLLRYLFLGQIGKTVVFDSNKNLLLSSGEELNIKVIDMLKEEIDDMTAEKESKLIRIRDGIIYSIRKKLITIGKHIYYAFFYTEKKNPLQTDRAGIEFIQPQKIESKYYDSLFFMAGTIDKLKYPVEKVIKSNITVLICGESGTGKESLAYYIYLNSDLKNNQFIHINCAELNEKSWEFLLNHATSPISMLDQTLYFSNLNRIERKRIPGLLSLLKDINESNRSRLIFSSTTEKQLSDVETKFLDELNAVSITIPELRKQKEKIPILFSKLLSQLNYEIPHQIIGIKDEALNLLTEYYWPNNFPNFYRLTKEIVVNATDSVIDTKTVEMVLEKEKHTMLISPDSEKAYVLSLNQNLKNIEKDIVNKVLEEEGGNQSAAAKRLEISRTTLWRMLASQ